MDCEGYEYGRDSDSVPSIIDLGEEIQLYHAKGMRDPFPARERTVVVGCFPTFSGQEFDAFIKAKQKLMSYYDLQIVEEKHLFSPVIRMFNPPRQFSIPYRFSDLVKLIRKAKRAPPDVVDYDVHPKHLVNKFFRRKSAKAMLFIDRVGECSAEFEEKYHQVANSYRGGNISFMLGDIDASKDDFWSFQLHKGGAPLIFIRSTSGQNYFKAKLESKEEIESFVEDYQMGRLSITQENIGPVEEVVAESFQEMVIDSERNVFLEVGPWCRYCDHCKTLAGVLEDVANRYKNDPNVSIAKLYKNDNVKGLVDDPLATEDCPTLYFKRADGKKLNFYLGLRTEEHIMKFIENNRRTPLIKPVTIESLTDVTDLIIREKKIAIVGVFPEFSGKEYQNFIKAADVLKLDYILRIMNAKHVPHCLCGPVVWLFSPFENRDKPFETKDFDVYALVQFAKYSSIPAVTVYDEHPQLIVDNCLYADCFYKTAMLFINRGHADAPTFESKYEQVAKKYREKRINFMLGDLEASRYAFQFVDLEKSHEPFIVIMNFRGDLYVKEGLKPEDDIDALVKDYNYFHVGVLVEYFEKDFQLLCGKIENDKAMLIINRECKDCRSLTSKYMTVAEKYKRLGIDFSDDFRNIEFNFWRHQSDKSVMAIMNSKRETFVKAFWDPDEDIEAFVKDYQAGNLAKYMRSCRVTIINAGGGIFEDFVMNSGKHVLVALYDYKWINSIKFELLLSHVALHFAKEKCIGLKIFQMECDIADDDSVIREALTPVWHRLKTLSEYDEPTLYLIKKDGEGVEVFDDELTEKNIIDFITESSMKSSWNFKLNKEHLWKG